MRTGLKITLIIVVAVGIFSAAAARADREGPAKLSLEICANVRPVEGGLKVVIGTQALPEMHLPAGTMIRPRTMAILDYGQPVEFVELIKSRCSQLIGQGGRRMPVVS